MSISKIIKTLYNIASRVGVTGNVSTRTGRKLVEESQRQMGWTESVVTFINEKGSPTTTSFVKPDVHLASDTEVADDLNIENFLPRGVKLITTLRGHQSTIQRISWSLDGKRLATPDNNGEVRIWDANNGHCEFILNGHREKVEEVAFSSDGTKLVSFGINDNKIIVWNAQNGDCIDVLCTRSRGFGYCSLTDHYVYTVSGWKDGSSYHSIYINMLGRQKNFKKAHTLGHPIHFAFSRAGDKVAFRESDDSVCVIPLGRDEAGVRSLPCKQALDFAFSPDGNVLAAAGRSEYKVCLWNSGGEFPRIFDNEITPTTVGLFLHW